mgnify:CR=1 FL=1
MVDDLPPGTHVEIFGIEKGKLTLFDVFVNGKFRKERYAQIFSQQIDNKFRAANLEKGVDLLPLSRQILSSMNR